MDLLHQQKSWGLLAAGFVVFTAAILITLVPSAIWCGRWGSSLSLADSLRIGFIAYLINLAPLGIVGGDLVKAMMLAKEKPGNRAKSLASVIVDRIVGLYVLFLVAAVGVFVAGFWQYPNTRILCIVMLVVAVVSTIGIVLILLPGFLEGPFVQAFTKIPKVGRAISSLLDAIMIYRERRAVLFWTSVATIPVHTFLTLSLFLFALGLGFRAVPCREYFGIYPTSGILSTIPLPAGPQELGIVGLYRMSRMRSGDDDHAAEPRA